jgi:hypothetical protein
VAIHHIHDSYVIASHGVWLPGCYATRQAARYAFRFAYDRLQALQRQANARVGGTGGMITFEDLQHWHRTYGFMGVHETRDAERNSHMPSGNEHAREKDSSMDSLVVTGYPPVKMRVVVQRRSGDHLIARLDYKPEGLWVRHPANLHWLTDDDFFADVGHDPIIGWRRFAAGDEAVRGHDAMVPRVERL